MATGWWRAKPWLVPLIIPDSGGNLSMSLAYTTHLSPGTLVDNYGPRELHFLSHFVISSFHKFHVLFSLLLLPEYHSAIIFAIALHSRVVLHQLGVGKRIELKTTGIEGGVGQLERIPRVIFS
ncbi:hypothetical protein F4779DRAFT_69654 [Xylariaceae sp. FL0662B]|nr:hypothetical protein F4779DRAFT_69654 [Xylariaceae sp. FL0662B]